MHMNRLSGTLVLIGGLLAGSVFVEPGPAGAAIKKWKLGLQISPINIDTSEMTTKKKKAVGMGSYLVNAVGSCAECHSCPTYAFNQNPFDGGTGELNATNYLAGGARFGTIGSKNLTPNNSGKPAGLTQGQFITVMTTGVNPVRGEALKGVMP